MFNRLWTIYTPEDEIICTVETQEEAEALLSHLNRFS